jgi:hypothetical protein
VREWHLGDSRSDDRARELASLARALPRHVRRAALVADVGRDAEGDEGVLRVLVFRSSTLVLGVELTGDMSRPSLKGVISPPPRPGAEVVTRGPSTNRGPVAEDGTFTLGRVTRGPFSMLVLSPRRVVLVTEWVIL